MRNDIDACVVVAEPLKATSSSIGLLAGTSVALVICSLTCK